MQSAVYHEVNSKDVLRIVCLYRQVGIDYGSDCEFIFSSRIDPFADLVFLRGYCREIIDRKSVVDAGSSCLLSTVFLDESDCVFDLFLCYNYF